MVTCDDGGRDSDRDGLADACELALVRHFAPTLVVSTRDCLWRPDGGGLFGGYLNGAQPAGAGVRLAYLPAYTRDCGWGALTCVPRRAGCSGHDGDSELILVDVARSEDRWRVTGVFLSAHCGEHEAGDCRWHRGDALRAFSWHDGPIVWVARGKHAHYPTHASCDRGNWRRDTCDGPVVAARFPVIDAGRNIGSRDAPSWGPGGCVRGDMLAISPRDAVDDPDECMWDARRPFRGWQGAFRGTPPRAYAGMLAQFAGW